MAVRLRGLGVLSVWLLTAWLVSTATANAYTVKQTGSGAVVRWHRESVTLRIDPSMNAYFKKLRVKTLVDNAAGAWFGLPSVPELLINEGKPRELGFADGSDNSNGIYLVKDWQLAESSLAVTVATFESRTGRIVDTDILVNANHPFGMQDEVDGADRPDGAGMKKATNEKPSEFDLAGVMTHEMGHVLGLGESFNVRAATMWPNIARGETHQRDLDLDDEQGVEVAYEGPMLADAEAAGGCGGSSVVLRRPRGPGAHGWILLGFAMFAAGLWLRRRSSGPQRGLTAMGLVLLFAAPFEPGIESTTDHERVSVLRTLALRRMPLAERQRGLHDAANAESVPVRMAAAAVLERVGGREDLDLATKLALDPNQEVRSAGARALARLRTAPPAKRLAASDPEAQARIGKLLDGTLGVIDGEVVQVGAEMRKGLVWSRLLVHGEHETASVDIPGGTLGDFTQIISEQELPDDGDRIVVARRASGPHAWAHLRDGVVYGGFLGDGAAIEWDAR